MDQSVCSHNTEDFEIHLPSSDESVDFFCKMWSKLWWVLVVENGARIAPHANGCELQWKQISMGILFTRLLNGASFEFAVARNRITGAPNNPAKNQPDTTLLNSWTFS